MKTKLFHGDLNIEDLANILVTRFNRANLIARKSITSGKAVIQIGTTEYASSGGDTALGVTLMQNEDGVSVSVGQQAWFGIAASLGMSAIVTLMNPINLLNRLDDIAQDLENLQLDDEVWKVIEEVAKTVGASQQLSAKLRNLQCEYCGVANSIEEGDCASCGAPLGNVQPTTCFNCGFAIDNSTVVCPNCDTDLR